MTWPFGNLPMFSYQSILIDPPWQYEMWTENGYEKSPESQYTTMSDQAILDLPVGHLADTQCDLVLWGVWPKLPLLTACVARWGFNYVTGGSWIKTTKDGTRLKIGTGYTFRSACEPFVVGRLGRPQRRNTDIPNVIIAPAREHSRKPDEMRQLVMKMTPGARRVDLFSRAPWPGNDVWGNETEKFNV